MYSCNLLFSLSFYLCSVFTNSMISFGFLPDEYEYDWGEKIGIIQ
ncbi:hypothetical protein MITSMUL_03647 [Mitsuokella multacida DSM 20544]|uniref:Uncharacterized protein n=1 Tax=Mitsuokella multacida DSM 20544 TaxID=500635 RepID=C9KKE8_9FIRM|nr:hypothetical protein MITSMUL_03647 [Mitsuokella multacida DSM 20544]